MWVTKIFGGLIFDKARKKGRRGKKEGMEEGREKKEGRERKEGGMERGREKKRKEGKKDMTRGMLGKLS